MHRPIIEIELDRADPSEPLTSFDVARGKVVITSNYPLSFTAIELKFKGITKTNTMRPITNLFEFQILDEEEEIPYNNMSKPNGFVNKHTMLHLTQDIGYVDGDARKGPIKLIKGRNELPFEFVIPLSYHCGGDTFLLKAWHSVTRVQSYELPPIFYFSQGITRASIEYTVKVTCRNRILPNIRVEKPILYVPNDSSEPLEGGSIIKGSTSYSKLCTFDMSTTRSLCQYVISIVKNSTLTIQLTLEARFKNSNPKLSIDSPFSGELFLVYNIPPEIMQVTHANKLYLQSFKATLTSTVKIKGAEELPEYYYFTTTLGQVHLNNMEIDLISESDENALELAFLYPHIQVPKSVTPNFKTCHISLEHKLKLDLKFTVFSMPHPPHLLDKLKQDIKHVVIECSNFTIVNQLRKNLE
ncbi:uncharacterized protein KQ657_003900 [Scheffersomyces spartinae]|uniref:Arrestin-like N-terminal domain-containing protein n=1 Tax=Scheffersomyces spartinae TaxID=45513 RepID=A0A9P7VC42_9ASCO|nr:uncharacterized protein KQ657_003900 [Scheffersomyces spartinae]KAG7195371.1 hypothetical protein KQ657_003900 [Scheffersomyces spartinae]